MKILKALGYYAAADIFSLFIGLTLAVSGSEVLRVICAVCTAGILVCLVGSLGINTARHDMKNERISGSGSIVSASAMAAAVSAPGLVSWLLLKLSTVGGFDFYRWHKLINGYFLQVYNFINHDASSAALTSGQVWIMLPLAFVPAIVFFVGYFLVRSNLLNNN